MKSRRSARDFRTGRAGGIPGRAACKSARGWQAAGFGIPYLPSLVEEGSPGKSHCTGRRKCRAIGRRPRAGSIQGSPNGVVRVACHAQGSWLRAWGRGCWMGTVTAGAGGAALTRMILTPVARGSRGAIWVLRAFSLLMVVLAACRLTLSEPRASPPRRGQLRGEVEQLPLHPVQRLLSSLNK
jgi:hypothetical protein